MTDILDGEIIKVNTRICRSEDDAYRVQLLLDYNEALDLNCYQQAWRLASQRYPALRTCFDWRDGLVQIITADSSINLDNFTIKDISHLPQDARAQEIIKIQQLEIKTSSQRRVAL
jgi:hypothetical protein